MQSESLHQGVINICFKPEDEEKFKVVIDSTYAEFIQSAGIGKTYIDVNMDFNRLCLNVTINTYSVSQLRAIINSVLYLVHVTLSTLSVIQKVS
ncbi:MAG: hypothetical protein QXL96_02980 [Ignisphaera sp.]